MPRRRSLTDRVTDSFRILTELDISHAYERQAGTIALIVLAVLVVAVVVIARQVRGPEHVPVTMEFPGAAGIAGGDPVLLRGVPIGRVRGVQLLGPGRVQVTTSVDEQYAPRRDATAQIVALDMVGSQAVAYEPGSAAEALPAGVPIAGEDAVTLQMQLAALREQAQTIAVNLRGLDPEAFREDLARTQQALDRARATTQRFPADTVTGELDALFGEGKQVVARLDTLRAAFPAAAIAEQRDSLMASASVLMEHVGAIQGSLGRIRERMAAGEGTLGRFQRDSTLRLELDAVRASLQSLQEKLLGRRPPSAP